MIDALEGIYNAVTSFAQLVLWGVVTAINYVIAAVGALLGVVLAALPGFPDPPTFAQDSWVGWLNWFFPIGEFLALAVLFVTLWLSFLLIRIAARWVKAL